MSVCSQQPVWPLLAQGVLQENWKVAMAVSDQVKSNQTPQTVISLESSFEPDSGHEQIEVQSMKTI